jgi:hypothetical protein
MGKKYTTPEMTVYGDTSSDSPDVFAHGFGGGESDSQNLGDAFGKYGKAMIGYNRQRGRSLGDRVPPHREGTGALQVSASGLLDVASTVARKVKYTSIDFTGHSLGCPIIVAAYRMVKEGNLPSFLVERQKDLDDIMSQAHIDLVAPAGLTEMAILAPTNEFCVHSLVMALCAGAISVARDSDLSLEEMSSQLPRLVNAGKYVIGDPLFTIAEGFDIGNIRTLQGVSTIYQDKPDNLGIIAYRNDEIVPYSDIVATLQNPNFKGLDKALRVIGHGSNPVRLLKLIARGQISVLAPANVGEFILDSLSGCKTSVDGSSAKALYRLSQEVIDLEGGHSELLTKRGAGPLADAIMSRREQQELAPAA